MHHLRPGLPAEPLVERHGLEQAGGAPRCPPLSVLVLCPCSVNARSPSGTLERRVARAWPTPLRSPASRLRRCAGAEGRSIRTSRPRRIALPGQVRSACRVAVARAGVGLAIVMLRTSVHGDDVGVALRRIAASTPRDLMNRSLCPSRGRFSRRSLSKFV